MGYLGQLINKIWQICPLVVIFLAKFKKCSDKFWHNSTPNFKIKMRSLDPPLDRLANQDKSSFSKYYPATMLKVLFFSRSNFQGATVAVDM